MTEIANLVSRISYLTTLIDNSDELIDNLTTQRDRRHYERAYLVRRVESLEVGI